MAKRKTEKKANKKESCDCCGCRCKWAMLKLACMAFILFLMTVWHSLGNALLSVPWWVYLILLVAFCLGGMSKGCWCHRK